MMSNLRQRAQAPRPVPFVRSYAVTHPTGTLIPPQPAGWDQLVYAASGVMTVITESGRWVAPPTRAVWVPSGSALRIEIAGRAQLRNLYLEVGVASLSASPAVLHVSGLLREVVLRAIALAPLWRADSAHRNLVAVLVDELATLPTAPLDLPMPRDARAARVADALIADPGTEQSLEALAAVAGASRRTIERLFRSETLMPIASWRSRLRILTALRLLGDGQTVAAISRQLGYSSPSAFVTMFRRETGITPTAYFREQPAEVERSRRSGTVGA
jgi:AraC-like DNA-binding protein